MRFQGALIALLLAMATYVPAQDKSAFDLAGPAPDGNLQAVPAALQKSMPGDLGRTALTNSRSAATLLREGYFTFGTTGGASPERHDDNCQITYGHPYALTSFAMLQWDGRWYRLDEFFTGTERDLRGDGDTLELRCERPGVCAVVLRIVQDALSGGMTLALRVRNLDAEAHEAAAALQIDPALGRWGDGYLFVDGRAVTRDTVFSGAPALQLQERPDPLHAGVRAEFTWPADVPQEIEVMNWEPALGDEYDPSTPRPRRLFDMVLRPRWETRTLDPDGETSGTMSLRLPETDFSDMVFLRWDMPTALSVDNGLLFPREFPVRMEMFINDARNVSDGVIHAAAGDDAIRATKTDWPFAAGAMDFTYLTLQYESGEVYEERVVPVTIYCAAYGEVLDSLTRWVYVPAVPLSDSGLVVEIDTVETSSLPRMSLYFTIRDEATAVPVLNARPEHIWLYENGTRLKDFTLEKDSRSSINAVDVVFVLDVTGSMSNEIAAVRDNVSAFAAELAQQGIGYRLGLVTFGDSVEEVHDFTGNVDVFTSWVRTLTAHGGGDRAENSLAALQTAARFSYLPQAHRAVIWITDADYHISDNVTPLSVHEVINELLGSGVIVHAIGSKTDREACERISQPTGGSYFDIDGNFRDILLDISRFDVSTVYHLAYTSPDPGAGERVVEITVHHGGRGGSAVWTSPAPPVVSLVPEILCYPNPFNPSVNIRLRNVGGRSGDLVVFDAAGREMTRYHVDGSSDSYQVAWSAGSRGAALPASGVYFVQLRLAAAGGAMESRTVSVVYSK